MRHVGHRDRPVRAAPAAATALRDLPRSASRTAAKAVIIFQPQACRLVPGRKSASARSTCPTLESALRGLRREPAPGVRAVRTAIFDGEVYFARASSATGLLVFPASSRRTKRFHVEIGGRPPTAARDVASDSVVRRRRRRRERRAARRQGRAERIRDEVAAGCAALRASAGSCPGLTVVLVGDDPASEVYVRNKEKAAREAGMRSRVVRLPASAAPRTSSSTRCRARTPTREVHGILVQLPLPAGDRRAAGHRGGRPRQGRRRLPSRQRGPAAHRPAGLRPVHAGRHHRAAEAARHPARGQARGRHRAQQHRRQADGGAAAARGLHGDRLPLADARPRRDRRRARTCCRGDRASRASSPATFIKPGAVVVDVGIHRVDGRGDAAARSSATIRARCAQLRREGLDAGRATCIRWRPRRRARVADAGAGRRRPADDRRSCCGTRWSAARAAASAERCASDPARRPDRRHRLGQDDGRRDLRASSARSSSTPTASPTSCSRPAARPTREVVARFGARSSGARRDRARLWRHRLRATPRRAAP